MRSGLLTKGERVNGFRVRVPVSGWQTRKSIGDLSLSDFFLFFILPAGRRLALHQHPVVFCP